MKKVLLASTALVAFAGAAAAEIAISGSAEMGVRGSNFDIDLSTAADVSDDLPMQFHTDINVEFSMSGETDGGLAFGASVGLEDGIGSGGGATDNDFDDGGIAVFISGDFGTLTLGNTDGAMDRVLTEAGNIGNPGSINDAETSHLGYQGDYLDGSGDGQIMRYDYTFEGFEFAFSLEQGAAAIVRENDDDLTWAIGFGYTFDFNGGNVDVGVAYQYADDGNIPINLTTESAIGVDFNGDGDTLDDIGLFDVIGVITGTGITNDVGEANVWGISAVLNLDSGFSAGVVYTDYDIDAVDGNVSHLGVGAGYSFDAFSVHANYGVWDADGITINGFGLAAGYDLGGGASVLAGYSQSQTGDIDFDLDGSGDDLTSSTYSIGVSFSF